MIETENLSESDLQAVQHFSRDFSRNRLAELCAQTLDSRRQLAELWAAHERRWGPEIDPHVRDTVARALSQGGGS